ncbi:MAG: prepilin-type N-terminal cleavage/methylation domain-containing protein [bacterium]|nr:prepilin-type N-terminal cleavage/methylation domain-containing protein [bacterium]
MQKGFTLIELILYVAIVAIVLGSLIPFAWNIIGGEVKSQTDQEVSSQARIVSEKIKTEIRNAKDFVSIIPPATLNLTDINNNSVVITLSAGKVTLNRGGAGATALNSDNTNVPALTFTNYTSADYKTKNIQFVFTIDDNYSGTRQEYNASPLTVESSAEIRGN